MSSQHDCGHKTCQAFHDCSVFGHLHEPVADHFECHYCGHRQEDMSGIDIACELKRIIAFSKATESPTPSEKVRFLRAQIKNSP